MNIPKFLSIYKDQGQGILTFLTSKHIMLKMFLKYNWYMLFEGKCHISFILPPSPHMPNMVLGT